MYITTAVCVCSLGKQMSPSSSLPFLPLHNHLLWKQMQEVLTLEQCQGEEKLLAKSKILSDPK